MTVSVDQINKVKYWTVVLGLFLFIFIGYIVYAQISKSEGMMPSDLEGGLMLTGFVAFNWWILIRIYTKAGYSVWWGLVGFLLGIGALLCFFMIAFGEWPILKELQELRSKGGETTKA